MLFASATKSWLPLLVRKYGSFIPAAPAAEVFPVMVDWPTTTSAGWESLVGKVFQMRTRLLPWSATMRRVPSDQTSLG